MSKHQQNQDELTSTRREFIKKYGKLAAVTPVALTTLMSPETSAAPKSKKIKKCTKGKAKKGECTLSDAQSINSTSTDSTSANTFRSKQFGNSSFGNSSSKNKKDKSGF